MFPGGGGPTVLAHPLGVDLWPVCTLGCREHQSTSIGLNATPEEELLGHTALCELTRGCPQKSPSLLWRPQPLALESCFQKLCLRGTQLLCTDELPEARVLPPVRES